MTCGEVKRVAGDLLLDLGDLLVEELDLAQAAVDRLALLDRQLDFAQPFAAGQPEQVADRRFLDQPPHQHGVALVLRARARPDQLAAAREPPPQRPRLLVGHPQPVQRPGGQQLGQRASVEPVGLRARLPDPRVARMHDQHLADVRLEDPRDLPRVAGHLEHHPIARAQALREQLQRLRRRLDPARRTDLARLHDRDLAEVAVNVQPNASHPFSFLAVDQWRTGGQTTQTDSCSQHTRAGRRGGHRKVGLKAHRARNGLPSLRSPESPCSGQPNLRPNPDSTLTATVSCPESRHLSRLARYGAYLMQ